MSDTSYDARKHPLRDDKLTFFLIFVPCFLVLIAVALLGQLVGVHWKGWLPGAENMSNVVAGTRAAVYTFMSNIS
ncbi:MAG: hypothetical protein ACOVK6_03055 [Ramlibacter sp.]